jgi:hypothetical protein
MEEIIFSRLIGQVQNCDETHNLGAENGFEILLQLQSKAVEEKKRVFDEDHHKKYVMYTMSLMKITTKSGLLILHSKHILQKTYDLITRSYQTCDIS